ncbi:hypothetical protein EJ03DRAFT_55093 [Teratosphaeria nubilosa]|uniref:Secreted protein n=1 Tax=Teratosphaeria nubilosa TaxID=161662 RepID=A0A6G1LDU1_9PEZI|nr:hypothetical protein EJ03DRAFT_55093 [Teratosphaeria nubilosa]
MGGSIFFLGFLSQVFTTWNHVLAGEVLALAPNTTRNDVQLMNASHSPGFQPFSAMQPANSGRSHIELLSHSRKSRSATLSQTLSSPLIFQSFGVVVA